MKVSKREIILIIVIIFAITAAAYYIYYLVPTMDEIDQINISIDQKRIKIISMQSAIDQIEGIKNEISVLEQDIAKQSEDIPQGISQPLQLVAITNIVNEKADGVIIVFNQNVTRFENYQKNLVLLSFATTYENLLSILEGFEELDMTNQIVTMNAANTEVSRSFYSSIIEGNYLTVGFTVEYYSFYAAPDAEPLGKQAFESSPIEYKNPFKPTLN